MPGTKVAKEYIEFSDSTKQSQSTSTDVDTVGNDYSPI